MKLIAKKDFARVPALANVQVDGTSHENHIHRGAVFAIGDFRAGDLAKKPITQDKVLVAQLLATGCVVDAEDGKAVKAVQDEVAQDKRREEQAQALDVKAAGGDLAQRLTALAAKAAK